MTKYEEIIEQADEAKDEDIEEALRLYKEAIDLEPERVDGYYNIALLYHQQGQLDDAIANFEKAAELEPNIPEVHNNLGVSYFKAQKLNASVHAFRKAIKLQPDYLDALYSLGKVYTELGKHKKAKSLFQKCLRIKPDFSEAKHALKQLDVEYDIWDLPQSDLSLRPYPVPIAGRKPKISILVYNLSSNCLVRTYPIAKVLERNFEVEIIGPVGNSGIFGPYKDELEYKTIPFQAYPQFLHNVDKLLKYITGDLIYAFKPLPTSLGVAMLKKIKDELPLLLDIEDWESAFFGRIPFDKLVSNFDIKFDSNSSQLLLSFGLHNGSALQQLLNPNSTLYVQWGEQMSSFADDLTVVSDFLQAKFGGFKLPHGADCNFFNPIKFDRSELRKAWDVQRKKVILFAGTPRPHKGIKELIESIRILDSNQILLMIVGSDSEGYLESILKEKDEENIEIIGSRPHSEMPGFLSMADLIVLPQNNSPAAQAQIPGKVFEAMAMGKPIIATAVSDLPMILDGCGWIVDLNEPHLLADAIGHVFDSPTEAREMGEKARQKCIREFSWDAMEKILTNIVSKLVISV